MSFSLSARLEQLNTAQKLDIFKFLFIFHFVTIFYSLSSRPLPSRLLPSRLLFLIVLHNIVKNICVRKAWSVTCIGTKLTHFKPVFSFILMVSSILQRMLQSPGKHLHKWKHLHEKDCPKPRRHIFCRISCQCVLLVYSWEELCSSCGKIL